MHNLAIYGLVHKSTILARLHILCNLRLFKSPRIKSINLITFIPFIYLQSYTLFRIILGDFDFDSLEAANRVLGPIYFLSYVFFVFFVLLNMFIAIICDTYGEIKEELADKKSDIELASYFKKGYHKVMDKLNLKRAQIIDIQKAITIADINNDRRIDFVEFRNSLRVK